MTAAARLCACGQPTRTPRHHRCEIHAFTRAVESIVDHGTRYADDPAAQMVASCGGLPQAAVAEALGISRERVRQIEQAAIAKMPRELRLAGITPDDLARVFAERAGSPYVESTSDDREREANRMRQARRDAAERLPEGAWSEHGQRVEAALEAAEAAVARAELASLRGRGAES